MSISAIRRALCVCRACGQTAPHKGRGLCAPCYDHARYCGILRGDPAPATGAWWAVPTAATFTDPAEVAALGGLAAAVAAVERDAGL